MPPPSTRRRCLAVVATSVLIGVGLGACDTDDGREMRDPTELQRWRLSGTTTTSSSTTTLPPTTPPVLATIPDSSANDSASDSLPADVSDPDASEPDGSEVALVGPGASAATGDPSTNTAGLAAPWPDGGAIDVAYTCDGAGDAPLIEWSAPPDDTAELALTFVDADANSYVHWVVFGLPATAGSIGGDAPPDVGTEGRNSRSGVGWTSVCPPVGTAHGYVVTLHFLSQQLEETADAAPSALVAAIQAVTFDEASLTGTYERLG